MPTINKEKYMSPVYGVAYSIVEYDKDSDEWGIRVKPSMVILSPSYDESKYRLTAVSANGSFTFELPLKQGAVGYHGQNSYKDVRLSNGMRVEGKTIIHSNNTMHDVEGRFATVEADITVLITEYTKVFYVEHGESTDSRSYRM